ncbi:MAG TPA: DUF3617 family protein [Terriglobales bacterium]|nr:DUF3617 family protein [Terriglobales bacterium]
MTKILLACATGAAALMGMQAVTPINVKTGQWETHTTIVLNGALGLPPEAIAKMTPEEAARYQAAMGQAAQRSDQKMESTDKGCLTKEDLTQDPTKLMGKQEPGMTCSGKILNSSSSDLSVRVTCTGMATMTYDLTYHATDPEHATGQGKGTATMGGHTMQTQFHSDMHWLGPTCPANGN